MAAILAKSSVSASVGKIRGFDGYALWRPSHRSRALDGLGRARHGSWCSSRRPRAGELLQIEFAVLVQDQSREEFVECNVADADR